jgi:dimethylargininase
LLSRHPCSDALLSPSPSTFGATLSFTRAIVRIPGSNFADGLTTVDLGSPHFDEVLHQHTRYCDALRECGLSLTIVDPDLRYPDSTFVEDAAILTPNAAIFTRPGASSREGEVAAIRPVVERFYSRTFSIDAPGTVDGGDICEAEDHFFIGISHRTNEAGAHQLAAHLNTLGYTASTIDIRAVTTILHLKSGISYIGDNTLVVMEEMAENPRFNSEFVRFNLLRVSPTESYAANCVRVNDRVLVPEGFPQLHSELIARGFSPLVLNMSEFQKMDGGLSCLSLRF